MFFKDSCKVNILKFIYPSKYDLQRNHTRKTEEKAFEKKANCPPAYSHTTVAPIRGNSLKIFLPKIEELIDTPYWYINVVSLDIRK